MYRSSISLDAVGSIMDSEESLIPPSSTPSTGRVGYRVCVTDLTRNYEYAHPKLFSNLDGWHLLFLDEVFLDINLDAQFPALVVPDSNTVCTKASFSMGGRSFRAVVYHAENRGEMDSVSVFCFSPWLPMTTKALDVLSTKERNQSQMHHAFAALAVATDHYSLLQNQGRKFPSFLSSEDIDHLKLRYGSDVVGSPDVGYHVLKSTFDQPKPEHTLGTESIPLVLRTLHFMSLYLKQATVEYSIAAVSKDAYAVQINGLIGWTILFQVNMCASEDALRSFLSTSSSSSPTMEVYFDAPRVTTAAHLKSRLSLLNHATVECADALMDPNVHDKFYYDTAGIGLKFMKKQHYKLFDSVSRREQGLVSTRTIALLLLANSEGDAVNLTPKQQAKLASELFYCCLMACEGALKRLYTSGSLESLSNTVAPRAGLAEPVQPLARVHTALLRSLLTVHPLQWLKIIAATLKYSEGDLLCYMSSKKGYLQVFLWPDAKKTAWDVQYAPEIAYYQREPSNWARKKAEAKPRNLAEGLYYIAFKVSNP